MNKINENIIICGIVKDCGNKISFNVNLAHETGKQFQDYTIVIYENNSSDNTKEELNKFKENIIILSEDIDITTKEKFAIWAYTKITGSDHPCRVEMISNARNKVFNEINKTSYDKYNYVIWIDMDSNGWDIHGIIDSFRKKDLWDVVYSNNDNDYYDLYAFRNDEFLFGPEIIGDIFWKNMPKIFHKK
jgi:hypothetical protein